jgi:putative heme-binding domain-containing protein
VNDAQPTVAFVAPARARLATAVVLLFWPFTAVVLAADPQANRASADGVPPAEALSASDAQMWSLIRASTADLTREQVASLFAADEGLRERRDATGRALQAALLEALAVHGGTPGVEYVRSVFESEVERREPAAYALSRFALTQRRLPADWQYLVRSLTVVEGASARSVLQALVRFRERATKPVWVRQVILIGLRQDDEGGRDALKLLAHWTGAAVGVDSAPPREALAAWQAWFRDKYPREGEPMWPVEPPGTRWTWSELWPVVDQADLAAQDRARGAEVFERARCARCHRVGNRGEQLGPELTRIATRLQRKQVLEGTLFPSLHPNEEYPCASVALKDGRVLTGTVIASGPDAVIVGDYNGSRSLVEKREIEEVAANGRSGMPAGLLDNLTQSEILDMFAFLLTGS